MFTSLAQSIAEFLVDNEVIDRTKLDIYVYGYEVLLSGILGFIIALILGLIFSQLFEAILFLAVFILLRSFTGGYHAATYLKCNIVFAINLAFVMLLSKHITVYLLPYHIIIGIVSFVIIAAFSPIESKFKPIAKQRKKKHRFLSLLILISLITISSLLYINFPVISLVIDLTALSVVLSMIIEITKKGLSNNESVKEKTPQCHS